MSLLHQQEPDSTRLNLATIRRNRGLSLRAIAEHTKIRPHYLRAIEAERFAELPGDVYSISYIRQYAAAIDYDPDVILGLFRETCPEPAFEPVVFGEPPARGNLSVIVHEFLAKLARPRGEKPGKKEPSNEPAKPEDSSPPATRPENEQTSGAIEWLIEQYREIDRRFAPCPASSHRGSRR
jgi:hypothetical protein